MKNGYFIGIDVSKETLDLSVVQGNQQVYYQRIVNSTKGLKQFFKSCPKEIELNTAVFCMEHTGIYNFYAGRVSSRDKSPRLCRSSSPAPDFVRACEYPSRLR